MGSVIGGARCPAKPPRVTAAHGWGCSRRVEPGTSAEGNPAVVLRKLHFKRSHHAIQPPFKR